MAAIAKEKYFQNKNENKSISLLLDEVENLLAKVDGQIGPQTEKIFSLMDEVWEKKKTLVDNAEKVKVESQLAYVTRRIYSSAKALLKTIGGVNLLREKRSRNGVPEDHWWWYLDVYLEEKRKKNLKRTGIFSLLLILGTVILVLIYDQFIAPPPEVRARLAYEDQIDELIANQEYQSAMVELEKALLLAPDYYPLWIKQGVLAKVMGMDSLVQTSFDTALNFADNLEFFYYERANVSMQFGLYDDVLTDADNLLEVNSQSPEGYLFRGLVFEARGQKDVAMEAFEKAAILAEDQNKNQLAATIRVRMGMLMQDITIPTQES